MTKQNVVPVEAVAAIAVAAVAGSSPLFPYPPPRAYGRRKYLSQLELGGGRIGAWVESMKASSPTHAKATAAPPSGDAAIDEQSAWVVRHPSALNKFEQIMSASKGKQIVMFMDYDGTLSPIVDDPDSAFMSDAMREAVRDVARYFPTAIVSGRCLDKVINFVRLADLYYAGSHGMDIKGPTRPRHAKARVGAPPPHPTPPPLTGSQTESISCRIFRLHAYLLLPLCVVQAKPVLFQPASEFLPMIDAVYKALFERTKSTPGARVENNKFCVSVHFRCVDEKSWSSLFEQVRSVLKAYPKLRLTQGRKVLEIRPTIKWDKGKALEFLLESLGFADCKNIMPVYIGDDRTDEDAFKVLRDRGQGFGILVSKFPKETNATYSLQEPSEASAHGPLLGALSYLQCDITRVKDFLVRLVEWKRLSRKACSKVQVA
ncbi:glycosyl hydrolase [Musa troglodytarum]|uniref:Trehalose 6-phosphate phosphatase n=1 Tax=Musa troglodytarum TaxID=320322 RepID=A0A9E7FXT6_9LILI|nr:glycosyl hydrolase [Musa troglodytarum]